MALLSSLFSSPPIPSSAFPSYSSLTSNFHAISNLRTQIQSSAASTNICTQKIDTSLLTIAESFYEDELWAAASLRVRSFNNFPPDTFGLQVSLPFFTFLNMKFQPSNFKRACLNCDKRASFIRSDIRLCILCFVFVKFCQDHARYLAEREFEALKERVSGKKTGFTRVSCINASIPLSHISALHDDLCSSCKVCFFPFLYTSPRNVVLFVVFLFGNKIDCVLVQLCSFLLMEKTGLQLAVLILINA